MKKFLDILMSLMVIVFVSYMLANFIVGVTTKNITGFINPEAKNTIEWVNDPSAGYIPVQTVEVHVFGKGIVKAEIPSEMSTLCVLYRDYPEIKGRRVVVHLRKDDKGYTIISGEIEK